MPNFWIMSYILCFKLLISASAALIWLFSYCKSYDFTYLKEVSPSSSRYCWNISSTSRSATVNEDSRFYYFWLCFFYFGFIYLLVSSSVSFFTFALLFVYCRGYTLLVSTNFMKVSGMTTLWQIYSSLSSLSRVLPNQSNQILILLDHRVQFLFAFWIF